VIWTDARATGDQHQRTTHVSRPDEIAPDRAAELELITHCKLIEEVWRDLAVINQLNGKRHLIGVVRWRSDRVAPFGLVPVVRGQAHVDVLPSAMARPAGHRQDQRFYSSGLVNSPGDPSQSPAQSPLYRCSRHGSPYMWYP
jgi:hypothetical protein